MGNEALIERFNQAQLYAITCAPKEGPQGYERMVRAACEGGADVIQFRDKLITGKDRYRVAARLRKICGDAHVLFIVNDALEVAMAVAADGVHLGQDDLPVAEAKKLMQEAGRLGSVLARHASADHYRQRELVPPSRMPARRNSTITLRLPNGSSAECPEPESSSSPVPTRSNLAAARESTRRPPGAPHR